jgi:8-oxo-dGTP diphosphatase
MKKIITLVIIGVLRSNNKYLLTFRQGDPEDTWANDHWQFPGGGMEYGETPETTLIRELKEELGIDVKIENLIPKIITKKRKDWQGIFICYLCSYDGKQKIKLNEEASDYGWFGVDEIKKLKALPGGHEIAVEAEKCGRERS